MVNFVNLKMIFFVNKKDIYLSVPLVKQMVGCNNLRQK